MKFYSLENINKRNCLYNLVFGERSNGKTYSVQEFALKRFIETGGQLAVLRRWREDFKGKRAPEYFKNIECNGKGVNMVKKLTKGKFDRIVYNSSCWYLAYWDDDTQRNVLDVKPFAYAFAISEMEHDKGSSYIGVTTILIDEFITRRAYIPDEFMLTMNVISTIIRNRAPDGIKIYMCANAVSSGKYNPYFKEMGLTNASKMKPGDIDVYEYGDSGLRVAIEYADSPNKNGKPSDVFFAFNNPKLKMITSGAWEMDIYPHLRTEIDKHSIMFSYFIQFEEHTLQADIVIDDINKFTFIHEKTTPIKNDDTDIVFNLNPCEKHNYYVSLVKPVNEITKKIIGFFVANKVFYQSNDIGEIINQYLIQCDKRYVKR